MNQKSNFSLVLFIGLLLLYLSFTIACQASKGVAQQKDPFATFDWLLGHWERSNLSRPGQKGFEVWEKAADQSLKGTGVLLQGLDTLFKEELRIVIRDNDLYYLALPQTTSPKKWVAFKITELDQQHFKSENPDHDFPKIISYFLESAGELRAKISGGETVQHFVFRKKE